MSFAHRFVSRFGRHTTGILSCFDRVIIKGSLPYLSDDMLKAWVDCGLRIRRADFVTHLEQRSEELVEHAQHIAQESERPYVYRRGRFRKDAYIEQIVREEQLTVGLVAVRCVHEHCRSIKLIHGKHRPELIFSKRPIRVLYYYILDPDFGLMHVRVETFFPDTIQVYVNGYEWLARQMDHRKIGYTHCDNCFVHVDDLPQAQQLADRFGDITWVQVLRQWAEKFNPHVAKGGWLDSKKYYWVTDQAEYSSDVLFREKATLKELSPKLLDYVVVNFKANDVMTFLGPKLHGNFQGEVVTNCRKERDPGARIKHRVKENWIKMPS